MKVAVRNHKMLLYGVAIISILLSSYVVSYFFVSTSYCGEFEGGIIHFRIFKHNWQLTFWKPLLLAENLCVSNEFYGHVGSGASLPLPVTKKRDSNNLLNLTNDSRDAADI